MHVDVLKFVRIHKFLQNIYIHSHLCFKSRILVPDDGPSRPKHVAIIDDIKRLLCLTVIHVYMPVLNCRSTTGWIPLTWTKILCPSVHFTYRSLLYCVTFSFFL